ncbi:hypothetical protein Tco_1182245 [Tanacetum coccineum]
MANLSKDIQCAGFDTRPPMLDRSDFESWQQHIRLYGLGKENGENILQSIDECPFKMGKFKETLAKGALHLGIRRFQPEENGNRSRVRYGYPWELVYGVLEFLRVGTMLDIFQNIHILYPIRRIGLLWIRRIDLLSFVVSWCVPSTDTRYLP